jgi:hypothetical protein
MNMNRTSAHRFWLTWRSDIVSASVVLVLMVMAFTVADLLARIAVDGCQ